MADTTCFAEKSKDQKYYWSRKFYPVCPYYQETPRGRTARIRQEVLMRKQ